MKLIRTSWPVTPWLVTLLLALWLTPAPLHAQRDSLRTLFLDAESWFQFEEYADALPLYMRLLEYDPGNDNLKYKIGICLLNDPYQKERSIPYLTDASDNINPDYKENTFREKTAPPDVLYYLGSAYLVNGELDQAARTFRKFLGVMDPEVYDEELVRSQIRACDIARRSMQAPVDLDVTLLGSGVNSQYADLNPVVSGDGKRMAFTRELPFYDGAFFSEKEGETWGTPRNITQELGFDANIYPVGLSFDGTEMILYFDDEYIGNLYYSKLLDGTWMKAEKLGGNISTRYWESHGSFSRDGKFLYFTSNRKGGYGGLDIYRSERAPDGSWGEPVNLGSRINSAYNEQAPFVTEDGQTLYFSSHGHPGMGGYDLYYSNLGADGSWGEAVNLGYPINSTDDDLFFQPAGNGSEAYFAVYAQSGMGRFDICHAEIYSDANPRLYEVAGRLRTADGEKELQRITVSVVDRPTGDTLIRTAPEAGSGTFGFTLKQGDYMVHMAGEGYEGLDQPLRIDRNSNKNCIWLGDALELALVPPAPMETESPGETETLQESEMAGTETADAEEPGTGADEAEVSVAQMLEIDVSDAAPPEVEMPEVETSESEALESEALESEMEEDVAEYETPTDPGEVEPLEQGAPDAREKSPGKRWVYILTVMVVAGAIFLFIIRRKRKKSS